MLEITTPLVAVGGIRTHLGKVIPIKPIDNKYLLIQASYLLKFLETCKLTSHSMRCRDFALTLLCSGLGISCLTFCCFSIVILLVITRSFSVSLCDAIKTEIPLVGGIACLEC